MEQYIREIIEKVAAEHNVKVHQILGPSNIPSIVAARRTVAVRAYLGKSDCSRREIAECMGMSYNWVIKTTRNLRQTLVPARSSAYPSPKEMIDAILARQGAEFDRVFNRRNQERKLNHIRRHVVREVRSAFPDVPYIELARITGMHHTSILYHCGRSAAARRQRIHPVSG